ncbi:MAG: Phosphoheptose isomerase [Parcubacteria group bacterium GW2011_GWA2_38_13]|nr:MAG: Phosphoheptose isomerase [Parcubacteria group bacterium GW2011_GWA2_38_13]
MNVSEIIRESINTKILLLDEKQIFAIQKMGEIIVHALHEGKTIFMAGNGGSAADAQHFAAELSGKFETERPGLRALALTANTSNITAIGNDFGFNKIFSRQIEGLGSQGDVLIGISTSGNSQNIIEAMSSAKNKNMINLGLLGNDGGTIKNLCDFSCVVPSKNTARIQECHILIIHILSAIADNAF